MTTGKFKNIYNNLKICLKTNSYDHVLDVVRQLGSNSQIGLLSYDLY